MRVTNGNPIAMANGEAAPPRVSEPQGILIRSDSPRFVKQPTGLFQSLRNSLGQNTLRLL